jgi:hypothetical protein
MVLGPFVLMAPHPFGVVALHPFVVVALRPFVVMARLVRATWSGTLSPSAPDGPSR